MCLTGLERRRDGRATASAAGDEDQRRPIQSKCHHTKTAASNTASAKSTTASTIANTTRTKTTAVTTIACATRAKITTATATV